MTYSRAIQGVCLKGISFWVYKIYRETILAIVLGLEGKGGRSTESTDIGQRKSRGIGKRKSKIVK